MAQTKLLLKPAASKRFLKWEANQILTILQWPDIHFQNTDIIWYTLHKWHRPAINAHFCERSQTSEIYQRGKKGKQWTKCEALNTVYHILGMQFDFGSFVCWLQFFKTNNLLYPDLLGYLKNKKNLPAFDMSTISNI